MRAALGEVPAVDPTRRDAAIAAALAAFDEDGTPERDAPRRSRRSRRRRRLSPTTVRVLSAAAVVAILALLVPLLAGIDGGDDDDGHLRGHRRRDREARATPATDGDERRRAPRPPPPRALADAAADADLGTYDDLDALADAVAAGELDAGAFESRRPSRPGDGAALRTRPAAGHSG